LHLNAANVVASLRAGKQNDPAAAFAANGPPAPARTSIQE